MSGRVVEELGARVMDITGGAPSSHHHSESLPYVQKVGKPRRQKLWTEIAATLKETFFHDDPLRPFKRPNKVAKGDLIAGLTIASLCIPQDIGYAKLANLAPQYGLLASFRRLCMLSWVAQRDIAIGPVAVVSLLLGTLLQNEIDPSNKEEYLRLAFTATFFAGITQATLATLMVGVRANFDPIRYWGFMAGAAITISLQQLKGLLGIKKFTKKTDVVSVMRSVFTAAHHGWNWQTILIGVSFLAFILIAKYIGKKKRKYFWLPAIAPLISVIISTFFVYITHAEKHGVQIVNHITKGVNPSSVNQIYFTGNYLVKGFRIGVVAGMIALTEAIAIGRTFAAMKDYQVDGNKEMVALGTMNVIGSMTSCYVATGSFSRSAVNFMAGCNTAVSNIVMSLVDLINIEAVILIWKVDKFDFVACMGAFFGVVFVSVEIGLLIAVTISFAKILLQVTRPRTALLGKLPRTTVYRNIQQYPEAMQVPGILIVRVDSAIYFSNSNYIKERILRWLVDEEEQLTKNSQPKIQYLIAEMSPVTDIDTSGIHALEELHRSLSKRGTFSFVEQLVLANPGQVVIDKLHASSFADLIGEDKIFLTVADAVLTCAPKTNEP
ncbi:sulfate transporter 1;3 [Actinidia rufa]|uniref:Sulfate transporter 13 n=1 Tax=Actinidia rufa TaxID=165716 RepID=A0A7J0ETT3_9ERIC|nr:sulfate transporter 1;3 [Actinidia rufa]